jgi:hypothetical protein
MGCDGSATASGQIDLTGTPLAIADQQLLASSDGTLDANTTKFSLGQNNQVAALVAKGNPIKGCNGVTAAPPPKYPLKYPLVPSGLVLQLAYQQ